MSAVLCGATCYLSAFAVIGMFVLATTILECLEGDARLINSAWQGFCIGAAGVFSVMIWWGWLPIVVIALLLGIWIAERGYEIDMEMGAL